MALTESQIQELYVAYFGRPADVEGKAYWSGSSTGISTVEGFAANMHSQSEFQDAYGSKETATQVNQIYQNLFGRDADAAGLNYWTGQIGNNTLKLAEIAVHLIWAAKNNDGGSADKTALENKVAAATAFTNDVAADAAAQLAYTADDSNAFTTAKTFISGITATAATAAEIDTQVAAVKSGAGTVGSTINLTTSGDTAKGTDNNDTIKGVISSTTTLNTFTDLDTIDGGKGVDTFELVVETNGVANTSPSFPVLSISNVETVQVKNLDPDSAGSFTVDFASISGVTKAVSNLSTGSVVFSNLAAGAEVESIGNGGASGATADLTAGYVAAATSSTVTYSGGADAGDLTVTGTKLTSQTIKSTGAQNDIDAITLAATTTSLTIDASSKFVTSGALDFGKTKTLTVTGSGAVDIDQASMDAQVIKVDASASTGDVDVKFADVAATTAAAGATITDVADITFVGGAGNDDVSFTADGDGAGGHELDIDLGAGDDKFTLAEQFQVGSATKAADKADGGAGTDTLVFAAADAEAQVKVTGFTNFEELTITGTLDSDVDVANFQASGITTVNLAAATSGASAEINFATGGGTVDLEAVNAIGADSTDFAVAGTATNDTVTIRNQAKDGTANVDVMNDKNLVLTGIETLVIDTTGLGTDATSDVTQDIGDLTFTPSGTTKATAKFQGSNNVNVEVIDAQFVDASGMTAAFVMASAMESDNATATAIAELTGGSKDDTLLGDADQATTIKGGAGDDNITGGTGKDTIEGGDGADTINESSGADTINGGAGKDNITIHASGSANASDAQVIDAGDGDDTVVAADDLTYGQTIKGGAGTDILTVAAVTAASHGSVVSGFETLNFTAVTGTQDLDNFANNTFTTVKVGASNNLTIDSVRDETICITAALADNADLIITKQDATGSADAVSLKITGSSAVDTGDGSNGEEIAIAGVETINIESDDSNTTNGNLTHIIDLDVAAATTINVTGDAGLNIQTDGSVVDVSKVTTLDASGLVLDKVTDAGVTYTATYNQAGNATTIKGTNGVDALTGGSLTDDTVTLGSGADTLTYGGGKDTVTGGAGIDTYNLAATAAARGTKAKHLVITDFAKDDKIDLTGISVGTVANTTLGAAITLSTGTEETLDNYLAAASNNDGSGNSVVTHFQFGGNTYLFLDRANAAYVDGTDSFIELTGLVTLKGSAITTGEILTLA